MEENNNPKNLNGEKKENDNSEKEKEVKQSMKKNKISNTLSSFAIVIAVVTFIVHHTRLECLPFDTASFLVVVLSVLVTLLLGYQIYNVFTINKRLNEHEKEFDKKLTEQKKEFDKKLTVLEEDNEKCHEKINDFLIVFYTEQLSIVKKLKNDFLGIKTFINLKTLIYKGKRLEYFEANRELENYVKGIIKIINNGGINITESEKKTLISMIENYKTGDKSLLELKNALENKKNDNEKK